MALERRKFLAGVGGLAAGLVSRSSQSSVSVDAITDQYVGDMLVTGFSGTTVASSSAQSLARKISKGEVGGVLFVKDNIGTRDDVVGLTALFCSNAPKKIVLAIDHEGGAVQRLVAAHGCDPLPPAFHVARDFSIDQARGLYQSAADAMARLGFNFNLAPVVDLHDPDNPAVGHFGRAFSTNPERVADYARAFINAFEEAGIGCALKHFPGQGSARADSHFLLADASAPWSENDLAPFRRLIGEGRVAAVMTGHAAQRVDDEAQEPAVLSRSVITTLLRKRLHFEGIALTDDLDMGAAGFGLERRAVVLRAIGAGNDLLIIRNRRNFDPDLSQSVAAWIRDALSRGDLSLEALNRSAARISALRGKLRAS